ncbi:hypothetical protein B0H16DRAFT_1536672 [Mycena metata]|uniref:Uncharacterized protein n=1 Tax=Mycena metata TaxID=1033252 RepID=A0AAD7N8Z5_9AGAR|nr:hypothetical protein B0H16DRAFT_1550423 [Mycena metata]KAJ7757441.1 hypothetical protein B0H16DRAFT_1536672 [Mycena metata]
MSMNISSPKAPRSSHHRSSSTRTSPRTSPRQDRVRPFGGHDGPRQPNYEVPQQAPLVPENLNDDRDAFNVDPGVGVLEAGGETYQPAIAPAGRHRFVGGFIGGMRKALQRNRGPGDGIAFPEPAVVHEEETQYESVPRAEPEPHYAAPSPEVHYPAPSPEGRTAPSPPQVHYATSAQYASPAVQYADVGPDAEYPERQPHHRQESSSSTSETAHATTQEHYEGTTIVNHDPNQLGTPQFVEPQPGSDYAKMDSPRSEASFGSYLTRVHHFFQTVNKLPWIAPDRVTVDYIPGRARQQAAQESPSHLRPRSRSRPVRRTTVSWYNSNIPQGSIDLLSGGSTHTPLDEFAQAKPLYAAAKYVPNTPAGQPAMAFASGGAGMASMPPPPPQPQPQPDRPRRVPVPQYDPEAGDPESERGGGYYEPRYPNGYVPYDQLDPAQRMVQTYTGSSVNSALPPR